MRSEFGGASGSNRLINVNTGEKEMRRLLGLLIYLSLIAPPAVAQTPPWDLTSQAPILGPWNYVDIGCGLENWHGTGSSLAWISTARN
jgi:hypothetical protein